MTRSGETSARPISEAIANREQGPSGAPHSGDVVADTGLPPTVVGHTLQRLYQNGYIEANDVTTNDGMGPEYMNIQLMEPGLRAVGVWLGEPFDAVLAIVVHQLAIEPDDLRKGKLQQFRDGLVDAGRDVVTNVRTAYATSSIPR
jgi:DNA-binding transcriptional ArsR family regulator